MKIDKGIPLPEPQRGAHSLKYPFQQMEVGDSVFFEGQKIGDRPYIAAKKCGRTKGRRFSGRNVEGGVRIWRVE